MPIATNFVSWNPSHATGQCTLCNIKFSLTYDRLLVFSLNKTGGPCPGGQTCQPLDMPWWVMTHQPGLWWWVIARDEPFWRKVTECWKICSYIYRKNDIILYQLHNLFQTRIVINTCHLCTFKNIRWWLKVVTVTYIALVVILWSGLPVKKANCVQPQNCWIMSQII